MLKTYYRLTKPGIVYGNVFTTLAAFLFASHWYFPLFLFVATILGVALVIASACVFNNYLDRGVDLKMSRTKDRALVTGAVSIRSALIYGTVLGLIGFALLFIYTNALTGWVVASGFIFYVVIYGIGKRASHWGTVVGSISGAVPLVAGYTAVIGRIDATAVILFLILVLWQMPHFYAIALYRSDEYRNAGIPVLPLKKGVKATKLYILFYIVVFILAALSLSLFGFAGYSYLAGMLVLGIVWLWLSLRGFSTPDDSLWARKLFLFSLVVLVVFSILLSVAWALP